MQRPASPELIMVTFYDLDQPSNQSQRSYRLLNTTTVLDIQQFIKKNLDDNYEIQFYFEKDKYFDGNLNSYVMTIIRKSQSRVICYKKVLSQKSNQIQKSQVQIENDMSINNNQQFNNSISIKPLGMGMQRGYQIQPMNIKNLLEQNQVKNIIQFTSQIPQVRGPSQQNQNNYKIQIKEMDPTSQYIEQSETMNNYNPQQNATNQNPKFQSQYQNSQIINQSQQQIQDLQQQQQLNQQDNESQKEISQLKIQSQGYEQQLRKYQIEIQNLKTEINNYKQSSQYNNNKLQEENQQLKNENQLLQKELKEAKLNNKSKIEALNKEKDNYNKEQQEQILKLNKQNNLLEQSQKKIQENFISICDLMNIKMEKIKKMSIANHDCISKLTYIEITDLLVNAVRTQEQVHCNCYKEQLLPLNKFKKLLTILEQYLNMIYQKQLSTLIRIQRNASLPINKCCSNNCNFIFILRNGQENSNIQMNQQCFCQNCQLFCQPERI